MRTHTRLDAYILQAVFRLVGTSLALTDTQEPLLSVLVERDKERNELVSE